MLPPGVRNAFPLRIVRSRAARRDLLVAIVLGAGAGALFVPQALLISRTIAGVFLRHRDLRAVAPWLALAVVIAFARAILSSAADFLANRAASRTKADLRARIAHGLLSAPSHRTEDAIPRGEIANVVVGGIETLHAYVAQYLPQLALAAIVPLVIVSAAFALDTLSGAVLLATGPLIPLFMYLIAGIARDQTRRQWRALSQMSARFLEALQGMVTLVAFGRSKDEVRTIAHVSDRFRTTTMGVLRVAFTSALVLEWLTTISTAVIAVEIGLRLLYARLHFVDALAVLLLAPEFYRPLRTLGAAFHAGMAGREAGVAVMRSLLEGSENAEREPSRDVAREPDTVVALQQWPAGGGDSSSAATAPAIRFDAVTCAGRGRHTPMLDRATFEIHPGETVALMGPSGAGKSTVVRVLLRFLAPESGTVAIDGIPLDRINPRAWRTHIAWVPQRPHLFHATVEENIRFARPTASRAEVERALEQARATDFVRRLPGGLDTLVGEGGAPLSGGQAQRLALTRAFLRDAAFVILDEPTASLDPENAHLVEDAMRELRRGRSVLLIAHRLTTIADVDRVVVLERGRVVEQGPPALLAQSKGLYARQFAAWGGTW